MLRVALLIGALAAGAAGCQTFVGIDDVSGHLPFIDGNYMVTIHRVRADGTTTDDIRLRGTANLDYDNRVASLSLVMLAASDGSALSEVSFTDLFFPDDSEEADFTLSLNIPEAAVATLPLPSEDTSINADMVFILEAQYSFCAVRLDGGASPTMGSILLATPQSTPAGLDSDCDLR